MDKVQRAKMAKLDMVLPSSLKPFEKLVYITLLFNGDEADTFNLATADIARLTGLQARAVDKIMLRLNDWAFITDDGRLAIPEGFGMSK